MTDDKKPEPQKIPPKLKVRPVASSAEPQQKQSDQRPGDAGAPPPKPVSATDEIVDGSEQQPLKTGEAPTVILKKANSDTENDQKKKTSRISLDSALSMRLNNAMTELDGKGQSNDQGPKTIRLSRPPSGGVQSSPPEPAATDAGGPKTIRLKRPGPVSDPSPSSQTAKKKTSRISLDNVLQSGAKEGDAPVKGGQTDVKTIRLQKRGADKPATVAPEDTEDGSADEQAAKSRTARLDQADTQEPAPDAVPSTQRKTIRIKRPDGSGAAKQGRTLSLARDKGAQPKKPHIEEQTEAQHELPEEPLQPQTPGLIFTLAAFAAVIVAALLVYMLAVQAFPDAGLSWLGQINP